MSQGLLQRRATTHWELSPDVAWRCCADSRSESRSSEEEQEEDGVHEVQEVQEEVVASQADKPMLGHF